MRPLYRARNSVPSSKGNDDPATHRACEASQLAARDGRVPWYAKVVAAVVAAYALSPIDLIPDFIPILGYLDDLLIVPLGVMLAVSLIPDALMMKLRAEANGCRKLTSRAGFFAILSVWIAVAGAAAWFLWWR